MLSKDELIVAIYGAWHIWKERYRRVFQKSFMPELQILELIKFDLLLLGAYLHEREGVDEPGA
jgi:hypothetical protein